MLTYMYNIIDFFNTKFFMYFVLCAVPFQTICFIWSATKIKRK